MFNPDKVKYYTDNKRVVVATCRWMGHIIRAEALCHPNDIFDYETGKKLATARLMGHAQIMLRDRVSDELDVLSAHINFLMDERSDAHVKQLFYQRQHYRIYFAFEGLAQRMCKPFITDSYRR